MSTQKRRLAKSKFKFKIVIPPCDEHEDMIAKSTLPEPVPNSIFCQRWKSVTETCPNATVVAETFMKKVTRKNLKKGYPQEKIKPFFVMCIKHFYIT